MRAFMPSAAAAIILAVTVLPPVAVAQGPNSLHPRVQPEDCSSLVAKRGPSKVWQTSFSATRPDMFDQVERIHVTPCFSSRTKCMQWLYWAQSDWPDNNWIGWCKTGLPY